MYNILPKQPNYSFMSKIRFYCNSLSSFKDLKQPATPDLLMNKFKHATTTRNVLETVGDHEKIMNSKHIMQALRTLFFLQKEGKSELSVKEIIRNKDFLKLCRRLKYSAGVIDINETIEALKVITYMGAPKDSTIVQVLLQLLRHNVNELSLSNIIFLEFLLQNYSGTPLADALKIALPIVFEIQLPIKIDSENLSSLREYLYYASRNKLSDKTVDLILKNMLKSKEMANCDGQTAKSIIWSLSDMKWNPALEPLLTKNIQTLLVNIDELSFDDLDSTLSKLSRRFNKENPYFSNELLCEAVVSQVIDKDLGFAHATYTLRKLDRFEITNKYLIDYATKKLLEESESFNEKTVYGIYVLMKYLSKTDHRPKDWDILVKKLENSNIVHKNFNINWLKFAAATTFLKIFNEDLVRAALSEDLNSTFKKRRNHFYLFLSLYHSIRLYNPVLMKLVPRNIRPKDFIQYLNTPEEFPLQGALFSAFGGEKYVNSGLFSKEGIFIDHTIVFRKGGYPVAVNANSTFLEDVEISTENDIVTILCLTPELYTKENHLRIGPTISIKVLEDLGYITVPICWNSWNNLADHEKIPYLVRSINEKLGTENNALNMHSS